MEGMDEHDDTDSDAEDHVEPSLDQLSQAFAEAMGRTSESDAADSEDAQVGEIDVPVTNEDSTTAEAGSCPLTPQSILEAILFVGHPENEPISADSIVRLLRGVEPDELPDLVAELNSSYADRMFPVVVATTPQGFRLELREEFEAVRQRFYGRVRKAKLSQLAVDVLAVVAYNQPVTRERLDQLLNQNGPQSSRILNQLVRRELIALRIVDGPPKKREYVTTDRFLQLFDLEDLADLPRSEEAN